MDLSAAGGRRPLVIAVVGTVVALAAGMGLDAIGARVVDWVPFGAVAVTVALRRDQWAAPVLVLCGGLLLVARSAFAPETLAQSAPTAVVVVCGVAMLRHIRGVRFSVVLGLAIALGLLLVVSTAIAAGPSTTLKACGIALLWPLIIAVTAAVEPRDRRALGLLLIMTGLVQTGIAIGESVVQWEWLRTFVASSRSDGTYIVRGNRILGDWTNRAQGTTGYPIPLAVLLTVSLLIAMFTDLVPRRVRPVVWAVLVVGVLLTGTRSAFAFGAVAIALGLVLAFRRLARPRVAIAASVVVVAAAVGGVCVFLVRSAVTGDFSLLHRSSVVESAISLFHLPLGQLLFGSGYNAAQRLQAVGLLRVDSATVVDNAYVTQFANTGLVGLAVLLAILVVGFLRAERTAKCIIACIAIAMFSFDLQYWHLLTMILLALLGEREGWGRSSGRAVIARRGGFLPSERGAQ